ncbi:MAG: hypothetical protein VKJ04_01015 [Vampirovibrionales bacterium]|nr:hypothetical protein [Vampirovibrionales bacterium]
MIQKILAEINIFRRLKKARQHIKNLEADNRLLQSYLQCATNLHTNHYGSFTPGDTVWDEKWNNAKGKRVLFCAAKDFSGSFYKWADAVNRYTAYAVRLVTCELHAYGYEYDLLVPAYLLSESLYKGKSNQLKSHDDCLKLATQANVIHFKDEKNLFLKDENHLISKLHDLALGHRIPTVFTHYGGYARKFKDDLVYQQLVNSFDARVAMTPDLNYDWFNGYYIPHSINTEFFNYLWEDKQLITHSPSIMSRKGTEAFEHAVSKFLTQYPDWQYKRIHNVSYEECLAQKQKSGLFFDQAGQENIKQLGVKDVIGWYGNSAIEAMVFGIPTIAHLSDSAFAGAERAGKDIRKSCPIINTGVSQIDMENTLKIFQKMSSAERKALSLKTRQWVNDFHSYPINANELASVYDQLINLQKMA